MNTPFIFASLIFVNFDLMYWKPSPSLLNFNIALTKFFMSVEEATKLPLDILNTKGGVTNIF